MMMTLTAVTLLCHLCATRGTVLLAKNASPFANFSYNMAVTLAQLGGCTAWPSTFDPAVHGHWSRQVGDEPLVTAFVKVP